MVDRKPTCIACAGAGGGANYEAGTGIQIVEDVISVSSDVAMKTDIPSGFTIYDSTDWSVFVDENDVVKEDILILIKLNNRGTGETNYPQYTYSNFETYFIPKGFKVKINNNNYCQLNIVRVSTDSTSYTTILKYKFSLQSILSNSLIYATKTTCLDITGSSDEISIVMTNSSQNPAIDKIIEYDKFVNNEFYNAIAICRRV